MTTCNRPGFGLVAARARNWLASYALRTLMTLLAIALSGSAFAQTGAPCGLTPTSSVNQVGTPGATLTYSFQTTATCAASSTGTVTLVSNTSGATFAPPLPINFVAAGGTTVSFSVTMGSTPGGFIAVDATMTAGFIAGGGSATINFISSIVEYVAVPPTTLGLNTLSSVQIVSNVQRNGSPATYQTQFANGATLLGAPVTPNGAGNAITTFNSAIPGTYNLTGSIQCPINLLDAACAAAPSPVSYTVTVEATGVSRVSPATDTTTPSVSRTVTAYFGSTNFPVADGTGLTWSATGPIGGDATLDGGTVASTNTSAGNASVTFLASVPGTYVVTASSVGCTFCAPGSVSFTINVTALPPIGSLVIISGNNQVGYVSESSNQDIVVELRDTSNNPIPGALINWSTTSGPGGNNSPANGGVTDANGQSNASIYFGSFPGTTTLLVADASNTVSVTPSFVTNAAELAIVSGDGQTAFPNAAFADPLVVVAQGDPFSGARQQQGPNTASKRSRAPVTMFVQPGVTINWVVTSGAATLSASSSITDGSGNATIGVTAGPTVGPVVITASRADVPSIQTSFNLAVAPPVASIVIISGNAQTGYVGDQSTQPIVVEARDASNSPMPGVQLNWSSISGPGTNNPPANGGITDAAGRSSANFYYGNSAGNTTLKVADVSNTASAAPTFTTLASTLMVGSGDGQSTEVNTPFPQPLTVIAQGATPAPALAAAGVTINWTVVSGSAVLSAPSSVTNASGVASINVTAGPLAGPIVISAERSDEPGVSVTFNLTATLVRTLSISSGNNQAGAPNAPLPLPLVVLAENNGDPVSGVAINWTILSGTGSLSPPNSNTNAAGNASTVLTLGAGGATKVKAARADDPTISVTFTFSTATLASLTSLKPAELAVAKAIDEFCPDLPANSSDPQVADLRARCIELIGSVGTDPEGVTKALGELYSDIALVQSEAGLLAAQAQFDNIKARIAALRSGTRGTSFGGLALNSSSGQLPIGTMFNGLLDGDKPETKEVGTDFSRWGFFAAGTIGRGNADPGLVSPGYDFDINGLTVGADYRYSDKLIFGGSLGYTKQGNDLIDSEGKLDTSGWSASAYGTFYRSDSWYSDAVLTYGRNTYLTERRVSYTFSLPGGGSTTIDQFGKGDSSGDSVTLAASFGRDFNKGGWGFGPYFRAMYTRLNFDPLVEDFEGPVLGSGLALAIDTRDVTSLSTTLGGKVTYAHSASWGVLMPHLQLEWQHEFKSDPSAVEAHFLYDPSATPFTITGDPIDTDFFRFGIGMSFVMTHGRSGFFYYERLISRERFAQNSLAFGLRLEF